MRQKLLTPLIAILVVSFGGLLATLIAGYEPALGLDLQGGISVTQQPVGDYSTESLDLAVDRIRERVDSLGVAEPEIIRQGDAIVVNLPGVKNQQQAIDLVKVTGQVYLRPVLQCVAADPTVDTSTTTGDTSTGNTSTGDTSTADTATGATTSDTATADTASDATPAGTDASATTAGEGPSRAPHGASDTSVPATDGTATSDTATSDTATSDTATSDTATSDTATTDTATGDTLIATGDTVTASTFDPATATTVVSDPTTTQILPLHGGGQCYVGPAGGTGEVFENDAAADILSGSGWGVTVGLRSGSDGEGVWNTLAAQCYDGTDACPSRQLAIELDGEIMSAPTVNARQFNGNVQITGSFTESEAKQLARVLKSGSLPVRMQTQSVQTVSPTLGKDSLHAAIVSGLIGVALVLLFIAFYYRLLGVIVLAGVLVSASLLWTVISWLSKTQGLALSLSGVAGIIVSVGVTVDSYVVFFERLKDEVRAGRTMKNSAQRGFTAAWHTIVVADLVSLMGALVLWYLTVGSVRNFAFFLGLSTLSDLVVAYMFTRPSVLLLARTQWMARRKVMGIEATPSVAASGGAACAAPSTPRATSSSPTCRRGGASGAACTTARRPSTSTASGGGASAPRAC